MYKFSCGFMAVFGVVASLVMWCVLAALAFAMGCSQRGTPAIEVQVAPATPGITYQLADALTAQAAGAAVTWSADGGVITQGGLWTAPSCIEMRAAAGLTPTASYVGLLSASTIVRATWVTSEGVSVVAQATIKTEEQVLSMEVCPVETTTPGEVVQQAISLVATCHTES